MIDGIEKSYGSVVCREMHFLKDYSYYDSGCIMYCVQGSRSPDFGAEIRPHSQCQKGCFFPIPGKNSQFEKKKKKKKNFFFFLFSIFISYNTNTEHIVTYLQY